MTMEARLRRYETKRHPARNLLVGLGAVSLASGALFGVYQVVDWVGHHVVGSTGSIIPDNVAKANALRDYEKAFATASPAGKFNLQFLRKTSYFTDAYPKAHGILGDANASGQEIQTKVGSACLANTDYDIYGGTITGTISGFSNGNISGNTPTSSAYAEINPNNPNQLIVGTGVKNNNQLVFNGLQTNGRLTPANAQTVNILDTYGCTGKTTISTPQITYK